MIVRLVSMALLITALLTLPTPTARAAANDDTLDGAGSDEADDFDPGEGDTQDGTIP